MARAPADKPDMKRISTRIERIVAGLVLGVAFLVMASIIVPADTQATYTDHSHSGPVNHAGGSAPVNRHSDNNTSHSAEPTASLKEIGTIESSCYLVRIYAGDTQPLYTVIDLTDGSTLGSLMTAEDVDSSFPDLQIMETSFDNFDSSNFHVIMSAEQDSYDFN